MREILDMLVRYEGRGFLILLYIPALIAILRNEKDRSIRLLFGYLPLLLLVVFFLPPVHFVYSKVDGADTYYRVLWLVPMMVTTAYSAVRTFSARIYVMIPICCAAVILCGSFVYTESGMVRAENRLHLPQGALDVCDTIINDTGGEETMAAVPSELVQFVRQYDSRILLAYGREMLMPAYAGYYHAVYDAMEKDEVIDTKKLAAACREYGCSYVVLNAARKTAGDLEDEGMELVSNVSGYIVYRDPEVINQTSAQRNTPVQRNTLSAYRTEAMASFP